MAGKGIDLAITMPFTLREIFISQIMVNVASEITELIFVNLMRRSGVFRKNDHA